MKILHCCLAAIYVDNHGYQENILPQMHKLQGHDVMIVASTETFISNQAIGYVKPSSYKTSENIPIVRLSYVSWLPHKLVRKLRLYKGLPEILNSFRPDCIFLHDVQFLSITNITTYINENSNTMVFADGHTDLINSARSWVSKNILHKIIYKWCAKKIEPYVSKFWGTLPARVAFYTDIYKIPSEKVDLLVMGGDLTNIDFTKKDLIRHNIRKELNIPDDAFLIITGGKIDKLKNIHLLMQAVNNLSNKNIKLLVFGNVSNDTKEEFNDLLPSASIHYIGWIPSEDVYNYFMASDLAFFPGTHSVLWEQSVSVGLPGIFKKWNGMQHIDVGGNVLFLEEITVKNIESTILQVYEDKELFNKMKKVSETKGIETFSYYEIAKKAIQI